MTVLVDIVSVIVAMVVVWRFGYLTGRRSAFRDVADHERARQNVASQQSRSPFTADETQAVYLESASRIEDYDRREAAGEDVSHEVRPRMPGGSDF